MPTFTTSGTTGKPKTITLTTEQMKARLASLTDAHRGAGFEALRSLYIDYHPDTLMGARYVMYGEQSGIKVLFSSFGDINATIAFIEQEKPEGIISTPSGLLNYANALNGSYKFSWMLASTARLAPTASKIIRASMGDNLWSSYACSEVGTISIASAAQIESIPNCVGTIVPGVTVGFENGEIKVQADTLIPGYDDPALTANSFRGGWYYTGDIGHMDGNSLVLDGRKK